MVLEFYADICWQKYEKKGFKVFAMGFRIYLFCEWMKRFFRFLKSIKSFYKFYSDYEYDGETCRFIIEQYTQVLCNRTKTMSKPTYYASGVINSLDEWYSDHAE